MAKPKVSEAAKLFIVQSLACFDSPSVVAAALKREYGVTISRQSIESYDPTKAAGERISQKWREIFEATRTAHIEDVARIGITHLSVRLRFLQRLVEKAEDQGNTALVAQLLEQAAREVGGSYTNRREMTGKDGGSIKTETKTETRTWRQILRDEHGG
jgi:hypothetical protein